MPSYIPPPTNPDIKRELKKQLLGISARSFEFFAGDFLVYIGLEGVSVTRYIGDGGIDAQGDLIAGMFHIPTRDTGQTLQKQRPASRHREIYRCFLKKGEHTRFY